MRQLLHIVEEISIVETERVITPEILQRHLPQFVSGVSVGGAASDGSSTFGPGEKEMVYKIIFEMRQQLIEIRQKLGMQTHTGMDHVHHQHVLTTGTTPGSIHLEKPVITEQLEEIEDALEVESSPQVPSPISAMPEIMTMDEIEKRAIQQALDRNGGNKRKAAEELNISERTIHRKIQDYGL